MLNRPSSDLFAERPVRSEFARGGVPIAVKRIVSVLVLMGIIGGSGAWLFWHAQQPATPEVIPTIKSEGTYKQRPAQPGGIDVPHQDVEVYHELDGHGAAKPEVEHLLPMPETPQEVPTPTPAPAPAAPVASAVEKLMAPEAAPRIETTVTAAPAAPVAAAPAPTVQTSAPAIVGTPKPQAVKPAAVASKPTAGKTAIQLASVTSEPAAQQLVKQLQHKHADALNGAILRIVRADLGAKGLYYRLQSQPMSLQQATHICAAIKQSNAGCLLVRY